LVLLFFLYEQNATPKKNASANGTNKGSTSRQVLADYDPVNATEHDLFLEAKLAAEVSVFGFRIIGICLVRHCFVFWIVRNNKIWRNS